MIDILIPFFDPRNNSQCISHFSYLSLSVCFEPKNNIQCISLSLSLSLSVLNPGIVYNVSLSLSLSVSISLYILQDVMLLGDFNADCSYMGGSDWDNVRMSTDPRFSWVITNDVDTTVAQAFCAYDR